MGNCCSSASVSNPVPGKTSEAEDPNFKRQARTTNHDATKPSQKYNQVSAANTPQKGKSNREIRQNDETGVHKIIRANDKSRRVVIMNDADDKETFLKLKKIEKDMEKKDIVFLVEALTEHFFFTNLTTDELYILSLTLLQSKCDRTNVLLQR